jgi:hypothetical protein
LKKKKAIRPIGLIRGLLISPRSEATLFASFSGKRRIPFRPIGLAIGSYDNYGFPRSGTTLFASFSGKRRMPFDELPS